MNQLALLDPARVIQLSKEGDWLDLRTTIDFARGHLNCCAHIPALELEHRVQELPDKSRALNLLGTQSNLCRARSFLEQRHYHIVSCWQTETAAQFLPALSAQGMIKTGTTSVSLWQPNPRLAAHIESIEQALGGPGRVLDLGCGSGREALFLARRGWTVVAVDKQASALQRLKISARANAVTVDARELDLSSKVLPFKRETFELVIMFRFLDRTLFPGIQHWLRPGGFFLGETFSIEALRFGKPRRERLLLKPGELVTIFGDWSHDNEQTRVLTDGRPLIALLAQKPGQ